jgi:membrane protein implicated in regulation of membrane protease activity
VRSAAVGILLCIAGAATLASVGWGLKDQGLYCIAVMLVALVAARRLADQGASTTDPHRRNRERAAIAKT